MGGVCKVLRAPVKHFQLQVWFLLDFSVPALKDVN